MLFSSIVMQAIFSYVNHARIRSWNQPVLSNESKVFCPRKHRRFHCFLRKCYSIKQFELWIYASERIDSTLEICQGEKGQAFLLIKSIFDIDIHCL